MIISRKRFEAEIEKAKRETEERCWMLAEREKFMEDVCRRFEKIEDRFRKMESGWIAVGANCELKNVEHLK